MNITEQPLLSICIPTYNRSEYLQKTLDSIVIQDRFLNTDDVEIIISDNCSTDNTEAVSEKYHELFPTKIHYFRNEKNVVDGNMEKSLRRGNGLFLKLNNDTLKHKPGSLEIVLSVIDNNIESKNILFFLNSTKKKNRNFLCKNLDSFIDYVSFTSTWIASFGMWKDDLIKIQDFSRYSHLQLTQTDVLFRTIGKDRAVSVNDDNFFTIQEVAKKGGYDIVTVFLDNYTFILKEALGNATIKSETYLKETKKLLLNFFPLWLAQIKIFPEVFYFKKQDWKYKIYKAFKKREIWLMLFYAKYVFYLCYFILKKLLINKIRK